MPDQSHLVNADAHMQMDSRPATASLVLHEDLLMRTLHFELEYQAWRLSELHAGRGDPGRPAYEYAFKVSGGYCSAWSHFNYMVGVCPHKTPVAQYNTSGCTCTTKILSSHRLSWCLPRLWKFIP